MKPYEKHKQKIEDLEWFAEFAKGCEHGSMTTEELLGRALIHAVDDTRDVQDLFENRRKDHDAGDP